MPAKRLMHYRMTTHPSGAIGLDPDIECAGHWKLVGDHYICTGCDATPPNTDEIGAAVAADTEARWILNELAADGALILDCERDTP